MMFSAKEFKKDRTNCKGPRASGVTTTACQDEGGVREMARPHSDGRACSVAHYFISKIRQNAFWAISLIGSQMSKKLHMQMLKNLVCAA